MSALVSIATGAVGGLVAGSLALMNTRRLDRNEALSHRLEALGAARLLVLDLERCHERISRLLPNLKLGDEGNPDLDLPRGAWEAHRMRLASSSTVRPEDWAKVAEVQRLIVEWNGIVTGRDAAASGVYGNPSIDLEFRRAGLMLAIPEAKSALFAYIESAEQDLRVAVGDG